jgi:hypothetical protein
MPKIEPFEKNSDAYDDWFKDKSQKDLIQFKLTEPLSYFYTIGVNTLKSKIIEQNGTGENILWIPELIAITLINDLKNEGYYFNKFSFIN